MTSQNVKKLAKFINSYIDKSKRYITRKSYYLCPDTIPLTIVRNILESGDNPQLHSVVDLLCGKTDPWERIKTSLLTERKNDDRGKYIYECGVVITEDLPRLPLLIGKFDHNAGAAAILEWRMKKGI